MFTPLYSDLTELPEITQNNVKARVYNGILFVNFYNVSRGTGTNWQTLTTLPEGYRPTEDILVPLTNPGSYGTANIGRTGCGYISTTGVVQVRFPTEVSATNGFHGCIATPVA